MLLKTSCKKNMKKKIINIILILVLIITASGCGQDTKNDKNDEEDIENEDQIDDEESKDDDSQYPMTIEDGEGNKIEINEPVKKVVSMAPNFTEIIFALGGEDKLVGVTQYCNYPEEAKKIDKIGDFEGPNLEKVIGKDTDVIFALSIDADEKVKLEEGGVLVILSDAEDIDSVFETIEMVGKTLDKKEEADELIKNMKNKRDSIKKRVKNAERKKVFYEVWNEPLMTAGPGSFTHELINLANGENIAQDTKSRYPEYSLELLLEKNPEVYLTADDGFKTVDDIINRDGYENIEAIQNNNIYFLHPDIISRAGPRIIDGLQMIAEAIHPEIFQGK